MRKEDIIEIGKRLYLKNLTVATSGNISIKTDKCIYITASGSSLGALKKEDIVLTDLDGNEISQGKASSEKKLHVAIYRLRPEINAIIHTHPVYLTSFASCHKALKEPIMSENILYFEDIPVAKYAMPSSDELVKNTIKHLKKRDVVMMANHGAIAIAANLEDAFAKIETAEYYAQVTLNTHIIGKPKYLSDEDISDLLKLKHSRS
ncbi:TPA: class II aldolase/adducin family protein [Candidatus Avigastranaerophilus faecigallinarum]|nr:class II aldolase/adducin family protein [Candidatus Avigastranaerophilus faecigallinarum]